MIVRGRVVDDLGNPVRSFKVEWRRPGENPIERPYQTGRTAETERQFESADGSFELQGLEPGEWVLTARGACDSRSVPKPVQVPTAGAGLTLTLPREAAIKGVVANMDGAAVAGASIYVVYGDQDTPGQVCGPSPRARSDGTGRFRVEGVQPGMFRVAATHSEHCDSELIQVTVAPGALADVKLRLTRGGRISGSVDPSQGQVSARQIELFSFNGTIGWRSTKSDQTGKFEIDNVIPQDYVIELRAEGYPTVAPENEWQGVRKRIKVRKGKTTRVVLGEDRGSIKIVGTVMCLEKPLEGVEVSASPKDAGEDRGQTVTTGADGRFELIVNGPGPYEFQVRAGCSQVNLDRTVEKREGMEVTLEVPAGAVSGLVLSAEGKPVAHAPLTLTQIPIKATADRDAFWKLYHRGKTANDGSFEFRLLEPGLYTLRTPDGFQSDSPPPRTPHGRVVLKAVPVGRTPAKPLEIRLPAEGRISGRVVNSDGQGVRDAYLVVLDSAGIPQSGEWETHTDVTGSFEVFSLAPGTYTVAVQTEAGRVRSQPVEVKADKTSEVKIEAR